MRESPIQRLSVDELTLHLIATGIIALAQRTEHGASVFPYPSQLQRGLDRLSVSAVQYGVTPPQGVPDLLHWAREPLSTWPLALPENAVGKQDTLMIDDQPSSMCDAWACAHPDVEAELTERHLMQRVFDICSQSTNTTGYVIFRKLVINHPVLTALELQQECIKPELVQLTEQLRDIYHRVPSGWAVDNHILCCAMCGNVLMPLVKGGVICENDSCQHRPVSIGRSIPISESPMWLNRGVRRFIAAPGRAELRIARNLEMCGVDVELWPMLDRYDLRLCFPDGEIWAVDVKDWANPFLLGRSVDRMKTTPRWDEAFFVFPDERLRQRRDYLRAFRQSCTILDTKTHALMETPFVKRVEERLKRG